jgi:hypothetical protein
MLPTKEMPQHGLPGIQIPASQRHRPSVWPIGQSQLSSWLPVLVPPRTPTRPDCLARRRRVHLARGVRLCLRKDHRPRNPAASTADFSAVYLLPTPPLRRLNHARDTGAPVTSPAAVVVPALVSHFALRVPWVSWFPSMAISVSRCGRQAVLLDARRMTLSVKSPNGFRVRI